jgi:Zn-dependent M32 family carboxypeptidase
MSGTPLTRNGRVRVTTADDEPGLTEPHAVVSTVRETGHAITPPENGR